MMEVGGRPVTLPELQLARLSQPKATDAGRIPHSEQGRPARCGKWVLDPHEREWTRDFGLRTLGFTLWLPISRGRTPCQISSMADWRPFAVGLPKRGLPEL